MLNRKSLVSALAEQAGSTQADADKFLTSLEAVLTQAITNGDKVQLPGFITVETVDRPARTGRNPQTGEPMEIAAGRNVKLTAGSRLKAAAKGE